MRSSDIVPMFHPVPILKIQTQSCLDGLKFIIHYTEVCKDIALVYGNQMVAEFRFFGFVFVSLFCIAVF